MAHKTELLYRDDAYQSAAKGRVLAISERGGIILDRTVFFATGGGQPGDSGVLQWAGHQSVRIASAVYGEDKTEVVHVPEEGAAVPPVGEPVIGEIDWHRRHGHMRIHTALHLLSVALPFPVSGGRIGETEGHLDFDIDGPAPDKAAIDAHLSAMVAADHPVSDEWITDEELLANPQLVKTMSVMPPMGSGRVRLVRIGDIDLQPCGGTHVRSTGEIGPVSVAKIENKGKQNRRVRIRLGDG